jgi:hypothetical protein
VAERIWTNCGSVPCRKRVSTANVPGSHADARDGPAARHQPRGEHAVGAEHAVHARDRVGGQRVGAVEREQLIDPGREHRRGRRRRPRRGEARRDRARDRALEPPGVGLARAQKRHAQRAPVARLADADQRARPRLACGTPAAKLAIIASKSPLPRRAACRRLPRPRRAAREPRRERALARRADRVGHGVEHARELLAQRRVVGLERDRARERRARASRSPLACCALRELAHARARPERCPAASTSIASVFAPVMISARASAMLLARRRRGSRAPCAAAVPPPPARFES